MDTFHVEIYSVPVVREGSVRIDLNAWIDAESEGDAVVLLLELLGSSSFRVVEQDLPDKVRGVVVDMDAFLSWDE